MNVTKENLRTFLGWCTVINLGILLYWFLAIVFANDFVFRTHTWLFEITEERFDEIHYTMMMCYKAAVTLFNLVPYLAFRLVQFKQDSKTVL